MIINRNLFKIAVADEAITLEEVTQQKSYVATTLGISLEEADYFVVTGKLSNNTYSADGDSLKIGMKEGELKELSETSEIYNLSQVNKPHIKYFITSLK
jgi:hypothetical protein